MPFKNAAQEYALMINAPAVWRKWVQLYGHAPGFESYKKRHKVKDKSKSRRRRRKNTSKSKRRRRS